MITLIIPTVYIRGPSFHNIIMSFFKINPKITLRLWAYFSIWNNVQYYHPAETPTNTYYFWDIRKYVPKFYNGRLWEFFFLSFKCPVKIFIVKTFWFK